MSTDLINKVLRVGEGRAMKSMQSQVGRIGLLEPEIEKLSDAELRAKTDEFKARLEGEKPETLDDILDEAFAVVREVGRRKLGQRLFDVQLIGSMTLHSGKIAEMKTGEGKTLAAVPAVYLNALAGRGVHLVTVNDYLARRDAEWMGPIYDALGISVGVIGSMMPEPERRDSYAADVTYGTNAEFGFDYLRDNMAVRLDDCVQRGHYFCIVDEVDSILIDEARTPLIISGVPEAATDTYYRFARIVPTLKAGDDFEVDEKHRTASPTESGVDKVEKALGIENLYLDVNGNLVNHLIQALKAHSLYRKDKEYIVREGELMIVDEFTGRVLEGRRYSEGLHQALEAKEGLRIREENQTLATITLQNYFRMYDKLSGMTGTASTEANEFAKIYEAEVVSIPTHRDMIRIDQNDYIFKTKDAKYRAVVEEIADAHERGQPVLVGTISVEISEMLSGMLTRRGVEHNVLNAKNHAREAEIIQHAGQPGTVTIATNMAGRGVDIKLGEGVADVGGLYIVGTERHESRRIDNQLRGRSGRQGDPGLSKFYLSLDDDLLRIFGPQTMFARLMNNQLEQGEALTHRWISKAIETAQKKVEARNYDIRKQVVEFDDVMNDQRKVIYEQRADIMDAESVSEVITDMRAETVQSIVAVNCPEGTYPEQWNVAELKDSVNDIFDLQPPIDDWLKEEAVEQDIIVERLQALADEAMAAKSASVEPERWNDVEKQILLQTLDHHWKEHLHTLDALRQVIHLRSYAQKKPIDEYKQEAFLLFERLLVAIREEVTKVLMRAQIQLDPPPLPELPDFITQHLDPFSADDDTADIDAAARGLMGGVPLMNIPRPPLPEYEDGGVVEAPLSRNAPCPCGSGKKYKHCHGQLA